MQLLRRHLPFLGGVVTAVLLTLLYMLHALDVAPWPLLTKLEAWSLDVRFQLRGPRPVKGDAIVIVGLDDKVRAEIPTLNQERTVWAAFIDRLAAMKPAAIGVDFIFDTPEQVLPPELTRDVRAQRPALEALARRPDLPADALAPVQRAGKLLADLDDRTRGDEKLAAAFARAGNVVPAVLLRFPGDGHPPGVTGRIERAAYPEVTIPKGLPAFRLPPRASGASGIDPALYGGVAAAGFVNNLVERDGATRRYYTALRLGDDVFLPMSLQCLRLYLGLPRSAISYVAGQRELRLGKLRAPLDPRGRILVNYLGGRAQFPTISAADVMAGRVKPERIRGKIVLVGPNDSANIDKAITPFDQLLPGVELHATVIHNLLHGEALEPVSWLQSLLAVLLLGLLAAALHLSVLRRHVVLVIPGVALLGGGYLVAAQLLFSRAGQPVDVIAPLLVLLLVTGVSLTLGYLTEGREKARIRNLFQHYLSADVIRELTDDPAKLALGGERREVTVLFSDIRGFSRLSERMDPQALAQFINEYLTPMTDAVLDGDGFLDKYIGDAVMAIFGAPNLRADHPVLAARAAFTMLERLRELNAGWAGQPFAPVGIGIGLNTGAVSLGNFGSSRRVEYTAVGDTVNLASRLEGLTRVYGCDVLVGETTMAQLGDAFWAREVDRVRVKGKDIPARIFELLAPRDRPCPVDLPTWESALEAYRQARWAEAREALRAVVAARGEDGPSQALLARIDRLEREGVDRATWDGVVAMETK